MTDTIKASVITDHAFEPRTKPVELRWLDRNVALPPNPHLCGFQYGERWGEYSIRTCRLGEAAHRETTVKR